MNKGNNIQGIRLKQKLLHDYKTESVKIEPRSLDSTEKNYKTILFNFFDKFKYH